MARTLRGLGIGLSDLGGRVSWGEAKLLIEQSAGDPSTVLGAKLAGWSYPASVPEILTLIAQIGDPKASRKVMPWALRLGAGTSATDEEVAEANAALEDGIVFT